MDRDDAQQQLLGFLQDLIADAQQQLLGFLQDLIADAANAGEARDDMPPAELAGYCLHALQAASTLPSEAAARRLATVTLAGLRPPR